MTYVYVLLSVKNRKRYVGLTSKNPMDRLEEHNKGNTKSTRNNRPYIRVYQEEYANKHDAYKREKFLKSGQGRKMLDQMLK